MAELPTGTVTFLFTDLEGSTRLWEEHPEVMKAALARHTETCAALGDDDAKLSLAHGRATTYRQAFEFAFTELDDIVEASGA